MIQSLWGEIVTSPAGCNCPHAAVVHGEGGGCRAAGCMCGWERDPKGALSERRTGVPAFRLGKVRKPLPEKLKEDGIKCRYCGEQAETRDHVVPRSRGGKGAAANIVFACLRCNQMKANLNPDEFITHCRKVIAFHEANQGRNIPVV